MTQPPADRSSKIRRVQADARAARIRADLAHRRTQDPDLYANVAAQYEQDGYGLDGYPADYPDDLKTLN